MHITCRQKLIFVLTLLDVHYILYYNVTERGFKMEASGVHRQKALTRQTVCHASPLAYIIGPHGFLKEASTCRIVRQDKPSSAPGQDTHQPTLRSTSKGVAQSGG